MKILFAADGSKYTKKALAFLVTHEALAGDGELVVLNVQPVMPPRVKAMVGAAAVQSYQKDEADKVLKSIDTMEKRVGVDGVTRMLRASAYMLGNDLENALKCADEAIALESDLLAAQDTRATLLVQLGRFKEAVAAYKAMETQFGFQFTRDIFTADPVFKQFVASPAFAAWLPE